MMRREVPNALLIVLCAVLMCCSEIATAQTLNHAELVRRGEVGIDTGYEPRSLESMVGSSTLIVKGRVGQYLGNKPFYGYSNGEDQSKESLITSRGIPESVVEDFAIPLSEYEIIVDEVLLSDFDADKLVLRRYETYPNRNEALAISDTASLFFLVINPDNRTYSMMGEACILNQDNGEYGYFALVPPSPFLPTRYERKPLDFMPSMRVEEFEAALRAEIARAGR